MATTGRQVFDLAIALIDEIPESGIVSEGDVKSYLVKTPALLTMLESEIAFLEKIEPTPGIITDLSKPMAVSDRAARMIMPYGLAAHLVLEENTDTASYFNQKFEELRRRIPSPFKKMVDVYGGIGDFYGGFD